MADKNTPVNPQEEEEETENLITLLDDEGAEHTFEVLDEVDHKDHHYMALVPYVTEAEDLVEEDLDLILMRVEEDEEGQYFDIVEDDDELTEVSKVFEERLSDLFDIEL